MVPPRSSTSNYMPGSFIASALVLDDGEWLSKNVDVVNMLFLPKECYLFMGHGIYPDLENTRNPSQREKDRGLILKPYNVPRILQSDTCTELNGYFGSRSVYEGQNRLKYHNTWFRCVAKMVQKPDGKMGLKGQYIWHSIGIFTHWDNAGERRVLCIDAPDDFRLALKALLPHSPIDPNDPFAMLEPLINELVKLFDDSVWRVRDEIRTLEQVQRLKTRPNFQEMQEISRHAIHVRESLTVLIDILEKMHQDQKQVYEKLGTELARNQWEQTLALLQLHVQIVKGLKERSISNVERLNTEVTLAYNIIIQQDSLVMKSIGLLTMIFLPATFISAFFSTTFFAYGDDGWGGMHNIWVYWVVTIPATVATILIFQAWVNNSNSKSLISGVQGFLIRKSLNSF